MYRAPTVENIDSDESTRLKALRKLEILDGEPDAAIDRITEIAAKLFQVPISAISLVDRDRLWFKSIKGLDCRQISRDVAFCSHTISQKTTLVVPDMRADERFMNNPLVTGPPGIRFYAGAPIFTSGGLAIGALSVIDTNPGQDLTVDQISILELLANAASEALHNASAAKRLGRSKRTTHDLHAQVAMTTLDGVWEWNVGEEKVYFSRRCQKLLGLEEKEVVANPDYWLSRVHPEELPGLRRQIAGFMRSHEHTFHVEHRVRHTDGGWRWVKASGFLVRGERGRCEKVVGSFVDVTTLRSQDPLTHLPNRSTFIEKLADQLQISLLDGSPLPVVMMADVHRFARVNDRFGTEHADRILHDIGKRLSDTVSLLNTGPASLVARHEGDKFLILFTGVGDPSIAQYLARRIQDAVSVPFLCNDVPIRVEIAMGIAVASKHHQALEVVQNAQIAMQQAQREGRAKCCLFVKKMLEENNMRCRLESELREAIEQNDLRAFYQPQFDLVTGKLIGCEALVRWQHPQFGLLTPDVFLPLAEESGQISNVDLWMMRTACEHMTRWRKLFKHAAKLRVSVNLSSHKFGELRLDKTIRDILHNSALPADALCIEITETVLMRDVEDAVPILESLQKIGVGLHIDDFGAGYSSFAQLYGLPFDTLKIDRSFMKKVLTDPKAHAIVEAIIDLARRLNLSVIAEGVEHVAHVTMLKKMGCQGGQGYFYSRPVDAVEFEAKFLAPASTGKTRRQENASAGKKRFNPVARFRAISA